jgi:hypothetical protein
MGPFAGHDDSISGITFTIDEKKLATSSADSTVLVWDIAKVAAKKSTRVADSDAAWHLLASDNAKVAFAAIENMAADPDKAIKRIADRVKPAEPLDKDWVAARLRDLDDAKFAQRDKATSELEQAGERVVPFLDKFLQSKPSVEARERAERLLAKLRGPTDEKGRAMQTRRGLEVLEWIGSDSARELVEILAKGAEGSSLTKEAKAALERWRR